LDSRKIGADVRFEKLERVIESFNDPAFKILSFTDLSKVFKI
jgi:hypothetical protein